MNENRKPDDKIAKHACNVIKRQIQSHVPDLEIYFLVHSENKRYESYLREKSQLLNLDAGINLCDYLDKPENTKVLRADRSRAICLAVQKTSGFLNIFKQEKYTALCCINYDRFCSESNLYNHALHLAWHIINMHSALKETASKNKNTVHNIPAPSPQDNLHADIFSCSQQNLNGNESILETFTRERISDTLTKKAGFHAENHAFPVSYDTLDFLFKNEKQQYKSNNIIASALQITQDIGKTYDQSSIEKWQSFALPAQEMAWNGYTPEKILGAALYTGENTYAQSIANMVAEKLNIKPEIITNLADYNPFANTEVNIRLHKKICAEKKEKIFQRLKTADDFPLLFKQAQTEIQNICSKSPIGWCAPGFIRAGEMMHSEKNKKISCHEIIDKADHTFDNEIGLLPWDTLQTFGRDIFYRRRLGQHITQEALVKIAEKNEEYGSIHYALTNSQIPVIPPSEEPQEHKESEHRAPQKFYETQI